MSRYAISTSVRGMGRKQRLFLRYRQKSTAWNNFYFKWGENHNESITNERVHRCHTEMMAERKLLRHISLREYWAMLNKEG